MLKMPILPKNGIPGSKTKQINLAGEGVKIIYFILKIL